MSSSPSVDLALAKKSGRPKMSRQDRLVRLRKVWMRPPRYFWPGVDSHEADGANTIRLSAGRAGTLRKIYVRPSPAAFGSASAPTLY